MEAQDLIRGDRVFIDDRWRKVHRAELLTDGTVSVETLWSAIRNGSWTLAPDDEVPTIPRRTRHDTK